MEKIVSIITSIYYSSLISYFIRKKLPFDSNDILAIIMRFDRDEDLVLSFQEFKNAFKPVKTIVNRKRYPKYLSTTKCFLQKIERHDPDEFESELFNSEKKYDKNLYSRSLKTSSGIFFPKLLYSSFYK